MPQEIHSRKKNWVLNLQGKTWSKQWPITETLFNNQHAFSQAVSKQISQA